jgi:asparagine synthase (glutamine-hydrolysing)
MISGKTVITFNGEIYNFLEFSLKLPPKCIKDKWILKPFAYRKIPQAILDRPKMGFGIPLNEWLRKELRDLMADTRSHRNLEKVGIQDTKMVMQFIQEHLSTKRNFGKTSHYSYLIL